MADILIRGMEMPRSCYECVIQHKFFSRLHCAELDGLKGFDSLELPHGYDRHPDCPLIALPEGHGRLVDADEVMLKVKTHDYPLATMNGSRDYGMFTPGFQQAVNETTTIVPAEKENDNE